MSDCCHQEKPKESEDGCCPPEKTPEGKKKVDYLFWGSLLAVIFGYGLHLVFGSQISHSSAFAKYSHSVFDLMNQMWWGLVLGIVFVGFMHKVPREFVVSLLGRGGTKRGLLRATAAGLLLDLCNHGILLVGMKLYERGASIGQTVAFLVASPWNSLSLTVILAALVGWKWTFVFIFLSAVVAMITGWVFERFVKAGILPDNPHKTDLPDGFRFFQEAKAGFRRTRFNGIFFKEVAAAGMKESRMILRWILFGAVLASLVRTFLDPMTFKEWFGPTLTGLALTLIAATVIEVCSEGSTPLAADLVNLGGAPGNGFAFLMTGVSTDYTEIMAIKERTRSWKIALFLPLITIPQVVLLGWLLNQGHF